MAPRALGTTLMLPTAALATACGGAESVHLDAGSDVGRDLADTASGADRVFVRDLSRSAVDLGNGEGGRTDGVGCRWVWGPTRAPSPSTTCTARWSRCRAGPRSSRPSGRTRCRGTPDQNDADVRASTVYLASELRATPPYEPRSSAARSTTGTWAATPKVSAHSRACRPVTTKSER